MLAVRLSLEGGGEGGEGVRAAWARLCARCMYVWISSTLASHVITTHPLTHRMHTCTRVHTATASFLGWLACALLTQRFPLGAVLILPASLIVAIPLFRRSGEEGGLLELAWS